MTLKNPTNYEKGKTLVFLVRHGDRIHISGNPNLGLKIPGPGLSALGKKQAKSVAKKFAKIKKRYEDSWAKASQPIPGEREIGIRERYYAPPWQFNDIIGYLQIGWDLGKYITGHIFLKLKHIPKTHYKRKYIPPNYSTMLEDI